MTGDEARALKKGDCVTWLKSGATGRVYLMTGNVVFSMVSIEWDGGGMTHHDPDFMDDYESPTTPEKGT